MSKQSLEDRNIVQYSETLFFHTFKTDRLFLSTCTSETMNPRLLD